jgi:hypothetical protein
VPLYAILSGLGVATIDPDGFVKCPRTTPPAQAAGQCHFKGMNPLLHGEEANRYPGTFYELITLSNNQGIIQKGEKE